MGETFKLVKDALLRKIVHTQRGLNGRLKKTH